MSAKLIVLARCLVVLALAVPLGADLARGQSTPPAPSPCGETRLPGKVEEMWRAIYEAALEGRLEALRTPIEWNELKPDLGAPPGGDPIAHLRALSGDGSGQRLLADLKLVLEGGCQPPRPGGKDTLYVWPRLATADLGRLTPAESALLDRLAGAEAAAAMRTSGRWTGWRLAIGADGTWHSLNKAD